MAVWFSRTIYFNRLPRSPSLKIIENSKKWGRGERGGGGPSTQHLDHLIFAAFRSKNKKKQKTKNGKWPVVHNPLSSFM